MKALIAGATGLVGTHVVAELIRSSYYHEVVVLVRQKNVFKDAMVKEIVYDYDKDTAFPAGIDDVYICLGTTIKKAGSKSAFEKVDFHYVTKIAHLAAKGNVKSIQVISSTGAKQASGNFYLRVKGEMEAKLCANQIPSIHILRPSLILGKRNEYRFGEQLGKWIMMPFVRLMKGRLLRYKPVEAGKIAHAMFTLAKKSAPGVHIIENEVIHQIYTDNNA